MSLDLIVNIDDAKDEVQVEAEVMIMESAQIGNVLCVQSLLKANADPNLGNTQGVPTPFVNNGWTPLLVSCWKGHKQCARALIKAGAELEKQSTKGNTALIISCQNGHELCARALLVAGANVEAADEDGNTSLMQPCDGGHE